MPKERTASEKRPFSEPWEDSDLILVVEDEKFHVHRQILSLHSPVFKAMLNSDIKEKTATEIPLEGKKMAEVLDFLNLLYLRESEGISRGYICVYVRNLQLSPQLPLGTSKIHHGI